MATVKRTNPKALEKINLKMKQLEGVETKVGWFETSKYEDGRPVAAVAAGNELGIQSRNIPARPFMRPASIDNASAWSLVAQRGAQAILRGDATAQQVMEALGLKSEGDIAKKISEIVSPPLSPITLGVRKYKQEGKPVTGATIGEIARLLHEGLLDVSGISTKPLNDTGHMIATLTHSTEST